MTQKKLAEKIGVGFSTISGWETGRFLPSQQDLNSIVEVLSLPQSYFLDSNYSKHEAGYILQESESSKLNHDKPNESIPESAVIRYHLSVKNKIFMGLDNPLIEGQMIVSLPIYETIRDGRGVELKGSEPVFIVDMFINAGHNWFCFICSNNISAPKINEGDLMICLDTMIAGYPNRNGYYLIYSKKSNIIAPYCVTFSPDGIFLTPGNPDLPLPMRKINEDEEILGKILEIRRKFYSSGMLNKALWYYEGANEILTGKDNYIKKYLY
jgi:transcriptional regulator with XRE-family HTH domain